MGTKIPSEVRNALRAIVRGSHGTTNDEDIREFVRSFTDLDRRSSEYFHRLALVRILNELGGGQQLDSLPEPLQGELFKDIVSPQIITISLNKDGRPQRIKKDFLDATLEEAEQWCAPAIRKNRPQTSKEKAAEFVDRIRPFVPVGGTIRQGLEAAKRPPT